MRRFWALLLCGCLCLALAGCRSTKYLPENSGEPQAEPAPLPAVPETVEPIRLDTLDVEFSVGGRDVNELLKLQAAFPEAMKRALAKQHVEVGSVAVTFGTSGEATELALQNGTVQLAFLPAEDYYPYRSGMIVAVERGDVPELSLGLVVARVTDDAAADDRFAAAVRGALPALAETLSAYTGERAAGGYEFDASLLEQLSRLYRTGDAVLLSTDADVAGKALTLRGVGHRLNEYLWGLSAIEVWDGEKQLQTIGMSEAADDPDGGIDGSTSCPEPALLFRAVDVNFDGYADIEVFGWTTNNTIPYFYWLWEPDAQRYVYTFRLQGPTIDAETKTLRASYRESAEISWEDVYEWQDGKPVRVSHTQVAE